MTHHSGKEERKLVSLEYTCSFAARGSLCPSRVYWNWCKQGAADAVLGEVVRS